MLQGDTNNLINGVPNTATTTTFELNICRKVVSSYRFAEVNSRLTFSACNITTSAVNMITGAGKSCTSLGDVQVAAMDVVPYKVCPFLFSLTTRTVFCCNTTTELGWTTCTPTIPSFILFATRM